MATLYTIESLGELIQEDGDQKDWSPSSDSTVELTEETRKRSMMDARYLARNQPNIKRAITLYQTYVLGVGFNVSPRRKNKEKVTSKAEQAVIHQANAAWKAFLKHNRKWWTVREFGTRTWRDGEQFTVKKTDIGTTWPPEVRFVDPEEIDDPTGSDQQNKGILTEDNDVAKPVKYIRVAPDSRDMVAEYAADEVFHTKIDVDSNQKRGCTRFFSVRWFAKWLRDLLGTEVQHRKLQASIVMQRKVKGSPGRVAAHLDNIKTSTTDFPEADDRRREKIRPGTIITTNEGVEVNFAQPDSNFSDASPLLRWLVLEISAATGFAYYMISTDSSDSNFASALVAESPVVLMVREEQKFFADAIEPIWEWVMEKAINAKEIKGVSLEKFTKLYEPEFDHPTIVTRDDIKIAQGANIAHMAKAISTAEFSRRVQADPEQMESELEDEADKEIYQLAGVNDAMNPSQDDKAASGKANQSGTNQGTGTKPPGHKDKVT